jgi:hypothetical protein
MVDLISDEEDFGEPVASEVEEDTAPSDKEEEGSMVDDGLLEQAIVPPNAPPST